MLQVNELKKGYGGRLLFSGASFTVHKGERLGLCGRNGHGKTTLFRLLLGEEEADAGEVSVPRGYRIGHVSQHLHFTEKTPLAETCLALPEAERDHVYKAEKLLSGLGFSEEDFHKPIDQFSGGYQVRVNLAKLLVSEPDMLLLDEPTNYLDVVSIRWFTRFLRSWPGELILITHDRAFMDSVCTHSMLVHREKLLKLEGGTEKLYSQVIAQEEVHEKTRRNQERKTKQAESFIERFGAKATKAKQAQSRVKMIERMPVLEKLANLHHLNFAFNQASFPAKQMLDVHGLSFGFADPLLQDLEFAVQSGDRIGIVGKNGRGKTTLLRLLAGDLKLQSGTVKEHPKLALGYFGQTNIQRLDPERTVEEEIASANRDVDPTRVRGICGTMLFSGDDAKKKIKVLSGGEKSRVMLGQLLATPCNCLLLDEPTNHLDVEAVESLVDSLEAFEGAVLFVSHTEWILSRLATKLIVFREGNATLFDGTYEQFLEQGGWDDEEAAVSGSEKRSKKEDKRARAEMVRERAELLRPIKKRLKAIESRIETLEGVEKRTEEALISASEASDSAKIQTLSKELSDAQSEIEQLFEEMEKLSEQEDEISVRFQL